MQTLYDEMIANGSQITPAEQAHAEQVEADATEARGRMLILHKKTHALNTRQREELQRHSKLGGAHCTKPYCSNDITNRL